MLVRCSLSIAVLLSLTGSGGLLAQDPAGSIAVRETAPQKPWTTVLRLEGSHNGEPAYRLELEAESVILAPERDAVAGLRPGGSLAITHEILRGYTDPDPLRPSGSRETLVRTLRVMPGPDGRVRHDYAVNGEPREFGPEGQAWLSRILRQNHRR